MRRQMEILTALLFLVSHQELSCPQVYGFQLPLPSLATSRHTIIQKSRGEGRNPVLLVVLWNKSKLFGPDDDDSDEEGEALAKQFYDQVRDRDTQSSSSSSSSSSSLSDNSAGSSPSPEQSKKKKFSGKTELSSSASSPDPLPFRSSRDGFFSNSYSNNSANGRKTPREQMMEREFQLVGRAEKGLKYQAIFAVCVLCFYVYVGLTGGIQSGGEVTWDLGADETMIEELAIPVPRDTEASYWL